MTTMQKLVWRIYAGLLGAATTIVAQKAMRAAWKFATQEEPPKPGDADSGPLEAAIWVLASTLGVSAAQYTASRATSERFAEAADAAAAGRPA